MLAATVATTIALTNPHNARTISSAGKPSANAAARLPMANSNAPPKISERRSPVLFHTIQLPALQIQIHIVWIGLYLPGYLGYLLRDITVRKQGDTIEGAHQARENQQDRKKGIVR